jgi:NitT/TauT family transport system substrate-binding protein
VGLIHRWVKPLEAGLDVKIVGSVHGGCLRLVGVNAAGVTRDVKSLKGKVIGVADLNSPAKQFYGIHLAKRGWTSTRMWSGASTLPTCWMWR